MVVKLTYFVAGYGAMGCLKVLDHYVTYLWGQQQGFLSVLFIVSANLVPEIDNPKLKFVALKYFQELHSGDSSCPKILQWSLKLAQMLVALLDQGFRN